MRAPLSWLRDFAPFPDDVGALRAALDDLGLVVEAVEHVGEGLGDVVVARVLEIHPIEGADKIRRVVVDAGGEPLDIVCGAHNFAVGDRVPLAPVGTVLPDADEPITRRKMRGVVSNGMLCSGDELGLTDDRAGLLVLGGDAPGEPGLPLMRGARPRARRGLRHHRGGQPPRRLVHQPASPATWRAASGCPSTPPSRPTRARAAGPWSRRRRQRSTRPTCARA